MVDISKLLKMVKRTLKDTQEITARLDRDKLRAEANSMYKDALSTSDPYEREIKLLAILNLLDPPSWDGV